MTLQKKDFIELEFTGKVKGGEIFDSNIKKDLEKLDPNANPKPLIFSLGEGMFLQGIDDFLIGKDFGEYTVELTPEKAFGTRLPQLVQMVPMKIFASQKLNPYPGTVFNFDGRMAKVLSVSGGRVMVDFNHPLSGKNVIYTLNVMRKVEDLNERIKAFIEFLFRRDFNFSVSGNKVTIEAEKEYAKFIEMFREKFKDVLGMELEVKEIEKKEEKKSQ